MNKKRFTVSVVVSGLLFFGCATVPEMMNNPTRADKSVIGINVSNKAPVGIFSNTPDKVYFVKLTNGNDVKSGILSVSNFKDGDNIYLLDADPGIYTVVGCYWEKKNLMTRQIMGKYISIFDGETVKRLKFEVKEKSLKYVGSLVIQDSMRGDGSSDEIRTHYRTLLAPFIPASGIFSGNAEYNGKIASHNYDETSNGIFVRKAVFSFKNTGWEKLIK